MIKVCSARPSRFAQLFPLPIEVIAFPGKPVRLSLPAMRPDGTSNEKWTVIAEHTRSIQREGRLT
jgi:hypothetical protein